MEFHQLFMKNYSLILFIKFLSLLIGYLSIGPIGALIALLLCNFFLGLSTKPYSKVYSVYHKEKQKSIQEDFFKITFLVLGHISKIDGHVSKNSIQMAYELMKELQLNDKQKVIAKSCFNLGKNLEYSLNESLNLLKKITRFNKGLLQLFIDIQYNGAKIDGLSDKKLNGLDMIFKKAGFTPLRQQYRFHTDFISHQNRTYSQNQKNPHNSFEPTLVNAYAILELPQTASKQEIKHAYRQLISRNHPDKLIARGASGASIKIATNKTQQIRKAYEQIYACKGW